MGYDVIWSKKAYKQLNDFEPTISKRIYKKVDELSENFRPRKVKKVRGIDVFRLRVGDYRVLLDIDKDKIIILKVAHRSNIYKK